MVNARTIVIETQGPPSVMRLGLAVSRIAPAQPGFIGLHAEALLFIGLIYWIIAFSMSRASQQLERNLGVGER